MKILRGGSAEVSNNKWFKFDIELDESDLQTIAVKNGLDLSKFSIGQKYLTLVKQAELLTTIEMEGQGLKGSKTTTQLNEDYRNYINTLPKAE